MFRRRQPAPERWAAIFAEDLIRSSTELLAVAAPDGRNDVTLPITIPIDETTGVVLLRPEGPLDAPRLPAVMGVARRGDGSFFIRIERWDGGPFVVPGLHDTRQKEPGDAGVLSLGFALDPSGLQITAFGTDARPMPLRFDEDTARALANAVFLALRAKISQAQADPSDADLGTGTGQDPRDPVPRSDKEAGN